MKVGVKECSKCEYYLNCSECAYPQLIQDMKSEIESLRNEKDSFIKTPSYEYLTNVLQNWTAFCKTHARFTKAIKDLLKENEELSQLLFEERELQNDR